jgi:two-component system, LytTR family, response regulator LytT
MARSSKSFQIAFVDDDPAFLEEAKQDIERYQSEEKVSLQISCFHDGLEFINRYESIFDVVFLDIDMPNMNGLTAAKKLREKDPTVCLLFITSLAQFAIQGYEVHAFNFLVKPVDYFFFSENLRKALAYVSAHEQEEVVLLKDKDLVKVPLSSIRYVEKDGNYLLYHTGEAVYRVRGTMQELLTTWKSRGFGQCLSGCLVNYRFVKRIGHNEVLVEKESLPLSRNYKNEFMEGFFAFIGGR